MTTDEARALFSEALDGELDPARVRELEACLERDASLRAEYEELARLMGKTRALGKPAAPPPDLLRGIQERLRARSGGRFYRDRFAERGSRSGMLPLVMAAVLLLVLGIALFALYTTDLDVADPPPGTIGDAPAAGGNGE